MRRFFSSFNNILKRHGFFIYPVLVVLLLFSSLFIFSKLARGKKLPAAATAPDIPGSVSASQRDDDHELRGVWIASVLNIDFPSEGGISADRMRAELDDIVSTVTQANLNAIFFQARPCADSLYPSEIFPWSIYLTGTQRQAPDEGFDPLSYLLNRAHENGVALHAWVNPYRVSMDTLDINALAPDSPARLHPEYTVPYDDGKLYFNPGLPEVRSLVTNGVRELLNKYPSLDGIHFDDYFYPYPKANALFDDAGAYEQYGDGLSLEDWRRENVTLLIRETYHIIKQTAPSCRFGVSPFGIWANETSDSPVRGSLTSGLESYFSLYCDSLAWAKEGIVDYLAPQIYWSFQTAAAPFDNIARWWNANLDGTDTDLYIGHGAYKAADFTKNEIPIQVEFSRSLLKYKGSIFYGYADIKADTAGLQTGLAALFQQETVFARLESTGEPLCLNFPESGSAAETGVTYLLGSSDPAFPVTYLGSPVSRTKDGYFALYTTLSPGENIIRVFQNGTERRHAINYNLTRASAAPVILDQFDITECSPASSFTVMTGDTVTVSCAAPAGSSVVAVIGGMSIKLAPTLDVTPEDGKMLREVYSGSIRPATFAAKDKPAALGTLKISASYQGQTITKSIGLVTQILSPPENAPGSESPSILDLDAGYAEVIRDYSHLKISPSSSFYDDFLPASKGMRDYVTEQADGYYKLRFGGYIEKDNVSITDGGKLYANRILSVAVENTSRSAQNNKRNSTDIRFGVLEHVPVNVTVAGRTMTVTLYHTDPAHIKPAEILPNPMIADVSGAPGNSDNTVVYTVTLKDAENFYGFDLVYENSRIIIKLNNPQTLAQGEFPLAGKTIAIDPGHGGTDTGAPGPSGAKNLHEANLNLFISLALETRLRALGADVVMTRSRDETMTLTERMDFLNEHTPDLAISVHHNSVAASANAAKVFGYVSLYSNQSGVLLAKTVSSVVTDRLSRFERPAAYQKLAVARNHRFPSMLSEMCFISNPEEFQWSITPGNYEKSALALAEGILEYYKAQEKYLESRS